MSPRTPVEYGALRPTGRVLVALLLLPDTLADALAAVDGAREALDLRAVEPTEELLAELRRALLEVPEDS